jgi:cell shape-determining protein MreC
MQDLLTAITTLNQYGWLAVTAFVVTGFLTGIVLTRGHHKEVIENFKARIEEFESQNRELRAENQMLRQALTLTQAQANHATTLTASMVEQTRGGSPA